MGGESVDRSLARVAGFVLLAVLLLGLTGASPSRASSECEGCAPWWHLTAGARPGHLDPASGRSEVQEFTTAPEAGGSERLFALFGGEEQKLGFFATEPLAAKEGYPVASAANIQKVLEEKLYGSGNVSVEEKAGEKGAVTYRIVSVGGGADRHVTPLKRVYVEDGTGSGPVKVATEGRSSGEIYLEATNLGDAGANGEVSPVIIRDRLPKGVTAVEYEAISGAGHGKVECELGTQQEPETTTCMFAGELPPYGQIEVRIGVFISPEAHTGDLNDVSVSGGEARSGVSIQRPLTLVEHAGESTPFGLEEYELTPENENGTLDARAGSHPFQTTLTLDLNQGEAFTGPNGEPEVEPAGGSIKDLQSKLPPGLIGNPTPFPRCTLPDFEAEKCPAESIVGAATVVANEPAVTGLKTIETPVFDLEPAAGEPARFGLLPTEETPVFIDTSVRSGEDYGVTNLTSNIVQVAADLRTQVTFWGVPGDPRHNNARGNCLGGGGSCGTSNETKPPPFFVLPTTCTGRPLESVAEIDPWSEPGHFAQASTSEPSVSEQPMPTLNGCDRLPFEPSIEVTPDDTNASSPTGLNVDLHVPQEGRLDGTSVAASAVKTIALALPPGFALDPSASDGLEACSEGLVGFQAGRGVGGFEEFDPGSEPGISSPAFTPYLPGSVAAKEAIATDRAPASEGTLQPGVNFCANGSKIGEVSIETPLLPAGGPLQGGVYLASQAANPFGSFLAIYIVAEDPTSGMLVKLPGELRLCQAAGEAIDGISCQAPGQIVTTLQNTPQVAFEDIQLHFFGGERALLASPARCGAYTTNASFVPWSAESGDEAAVTVHSSSTFDIATGPKTLSEPGGSSCPGGQQLPFNPSLRAGTTSIDAGSSTPLAVTISRDDGQQALRGFQLRLPAGLEGLISSVPLCPQAQANAGACGPASQIGETTVSAGVGGDPYTLAGGRVYLTEGYEGAPFGLSIVTPVKAGPLDLEDAPENHPACDCLVVRAKIEVDPQTAQLTISTAPGTGGIGAGGIPSIIDGIPLQIRDLNITIDRGGFVFNPTDCAALTITGTIAGDEGASAAVSSPFRVANCQSLKFTPKLTVLTRANGEFQGHGASLHLVIASPSAQANMRSLKLDLPQRLPARLQTIQKACPESTFDANPAACPKASVVGSASVQTPILSTTMAGPAYLVAKSGSGTSHPDESKTEKEEAAFPNLVLVLQGDGVKIDLSGALFVSEKNVTSVAFRAIPDVPIRRLDLILPEGKGSILAASSGLCTKKPLRITTAITGQNGARVKPGVRVGVEGCKHKKPKKRRRAKKGHK